MTSLGHHIYSKHFTALKLTRTPTDGTGYFEGLASTFDIDRDGERFAFGAWSDTILEWRKVGSMPPLFWSHRSTEPEDIIGRVLTMQETVDGLLISGQLDLSNPVAVSAYERMMAGTLDTMSVGFIYDRTHMDDGVRVIDQAELLEVSLTPVPSNPRARVSMVKNVSGNAELRDVKRRLDALETPRKDVSPASTVADDLLAQTQRERIDAALARGEQDRWNQDNADRVRLLSDGAIADAERDAIRLEDERRREASDRRDRERRERELAEEQRERYLRERPNGEDGLWVAAP